ncbi:MAG: hypothetical protein A2017_19580 [Lentisphaerae bacterium GWF2_44_16]|nr:MAG: hypothetical protein A2017_19580 [Lentisphaerae bacterium GWF2_44_16]
MLSFKKFIRSLIQKTFGEKFAVLSVALFFFPFITSAQQSGKSNSLSNKKTSAPAAVVIKEVPQIPQDGLVASVGRGGLTKSEYDFYLLRFANRLRKNVKSLSPEERKNALNEGLDDEILFQAALAEGALNDSYIRFMMSSLFRSNKTLSSIRPDQFKDSELKAYYDAHQKEFSEPAESHIKCAKFNSKARALNFIKTLKQSKTPVSSPEWNDLGWVSEKKQIVEFPTELSKKAANLKKGQISEPLSASFSRDICYVFICAEQKEARLIPYEEAKSKVKFALVNQKQKENYEILLKKMGFDPQKISEEDALFLSALNSGFQRDISVRQYCINSYVAKKKVKREQLLPELKKKYPVKLLETAK